MALTRWMTLYAAGGAITVIIIESVITCPRCGDARRETMPAVSCQISYRCPACGVELWPAAGDCCVFCTYGSVPCPAIQQQRAGRPL